MEFLAVTVGDIPTIFGFFSLSFDHKHCNSCGVNCSIFSVRRSSEGSIWNPCRSRIALKWDFSENSSQTSVWPLQESHSTGALVRSRESGGSPRSTVSKGLLYLVTLTWKMDAPVLITTMRPLRARISTLTIFQIFVFAVFYSGLLASKKNLSPSRRSGGTNFIRSARSRRVSSRCCISRCVCIASFWVSSFKRSCLVDVEVSCWGFMKAGSMVFFSWLIP